jgi:hypothetical protein
MTKLSLKAQFAQRAPTRAIDLVPSGSPEVVEIERGEWAIASARSDDLKAKRAIQAHR